MIKILLFFGFLIYQTTGLIPRNIVNYSHKEALLLINNWIQTIKESNMPLHTLYPTYTTAGHLNDRTKI